VRKHGLGWTRWSGPVLPTPRKHFWTAPMNARRTSRIAYTHNADDDDDVDDVGGGDSGYRKSRDVDAGPRSATNAATRMCCWSVADEVDGGRRRSARARVDPGWVNWTAVTRR